MAKKYPHTLKIDESKWLTWTVLAASNNKDLRYSSLRNARSGQQCCLGFAARQLGCAVGEIRNVPMPNMVPRIKALARAGHAFARIILTVADDAANLNDLSRLPHRQLKTRLRALFVKHGVKLVFTGRHRDALVKARRLDDANGCTRRSFADHGFSFSTSRCDPQRCIRSRTTRSLRARR